MIINYIFNEKNSIENEKFDKTIDFFDDKSFSFTFWNNINKMPQWYPDTALDLLYISMAVFAADRLVLRSDSSDGWSRVLELYIPVLDIERWNDNSELLEKTLNFLSGDYWKFNFRKRNLTKRELSYKNRFENSNKEAKNYNQVCMFSGGLDSFIGSVDILERKDTSTLFISHYGGGKGVKEYQDILKEKLIEKYLVESRDFHQYYAKVIGGIEDTTRTRSFMFFSHAIAVASTLGKKVDLIIPENGLISLNIPLTYSRFGTSSTRTTHPYYLKLVQLLLVNIGIKVIIKNPYQFLTKGEMMIHCRNKAFLQENLKNTMSCSHPDNGRMLKERETRHCGYCLPCVIRLAAIKKSGMIDESVYYDRKFLKGKTAKICSNSYKLAMQRFNPKYAFMSIQKSGSIVDDVEKFAELYIRGMEEVKDYLEDLK